MQKSRNVKKLKKYFADVLTPAKKGTYECFCGAGTRKNGTGLYVHGEHLKCFSCGFYGDIFNFLGLAYELKTLPEQINKFYELKKNNARYHFEVKPWIK